MDLASRSAVSQSLLADETLAARITEAFFSRHPEWEARFGAAGRRRCTEDARFHLSFLAGAVQAGSPAIFAEYATWCADMLAVRKIDRAHLLEHFDLLEEHLDLGDAGRALVGETIAAARLALSRGSAFVIERTDERTPLRLAYLSGALAGRRGEAWEATREAIRQGLSVADVYRDLVLWAQRHLGELWVGAAITVAQEHMASAVTQSVIARLYAEIPGDRPAGRALVAGVEGELHALPAQLASDLLELDGWDVAFVGTHVPLQSVLAAIEAEKPDVLGLSTTMGFNLPKLVALVAAVRAKFATLPIVVGGRAMRGALALSTELSLAVDGGDGAAFRVHAQPPRH